MEVSESFPLAGLPTAVKPTAREVFTDTSITGLPGISSLVSKVRPVGRAMVIDTVLKLSLSVSRHTATCFVSPALMLKFSM